jgi:hypothetical protein
MNFGKRGAGGGGVAGVTVTDSVAAPQALFSVAALLFAVTLDVAAVTWKK